MMFYTADGFEVFIPKKHMKLHAADLPMIKAALLKVNAAGKSFLKECVEFDHIVGKTVCVSTAPDDEIVFATRLGRSTKTRFVMGRVPEDCKHVSVIITKKDDGYKLITGYIGKPAEKEVDDPSIMSEDELLRSISFWSKHALIWGSQPVKHNNSTNKSTVCEAV